MSTLPQQHETMSVEEAAQILSVSRAYAYQLAREGNLPGARKLGNRIVVSRRALEAFLEAGDGDQVATQTND